MTVQLTDQTSASDGDPAYYRLYLSWPKGPSAPAGPLSSTVSLAFPDDPDWGAGVVSKPIT